MRIYLDHNATAPIRPECLELVNEWGNGSAVHGRGRKTRSLIESARSTVASCLGVSHRGVIFTSGATEANNMLVQGYQGSVIASFLEHPSILKARPDAHLVPLLPAGIIDLDALERVLRLHTRPLVCLTAAHNETGVVQPVNEAARLTHQYGGFFHTDAVQAYGRIALNYENFDYITLSGHKIGGFAGCGVLYVRDEAPLTPLQHGGGQEYGLRSGTENLLGIRSLALAMQAAKDDPWDTIRTWRDELEALLLSVPGIMAVVPSDSQRLPNTSLMAFPGVPSTTLVMRLDLAGFEVSAGSACHSGKVRTHNVLQALGLPQNIQNSIVRISIPYNAREEDVMLLAENIIKNSKHP